MLYGSYAQLERYKSNRVIRAAEYGRCSSDEQKKNGYTIGDQIDLMDEFCNEYELAVTDRYVDEGISATLEISKRKDLARLIEDAKQGKFDIVVFKCIDRFFRNVGEYYVCQRQLEKAGVTWLSIEESDLDPEDPDAAFKINIYLTMAEYEAKKTSKRIKFNNKNRIKNKQVVTGGQCFSFPWIVEGEPRNRHLSKNKEKEHIVMDMIEYQEKYQSKRKTLGYLNAKYSMALSMNTLTNILTNTLLYGEYKGVNDYVESYITKERFDKLQKILKKNAKEFFATKSIFIFGGIIKCPICGCQMAGNKFNRKPNNIYSYRCNKYRLNKSCTNTMAISERKIEKMLLDNLGEYIGNAIVNVESIEEVDKTNDNTIQIAKLREELNRLNVIFRKNRINEEEYDTEYLKLEKKIKKLEEDQEVKKQEVNIDALKELLQSDYRNIYNELTKENKKAFWRCIIREFKVDTKTRQIIPESILFF